MTPPQCSFAAMATVVDTSCAGQFQCFISNSPWDHEPVVAADQPGRRPTARGQPGSALILDESSFAKQGDRSVGVARQWSGRQEKTDNCRVAHQPGLALLTPRDIVEMLKETLAHKPEGKEALVARINQRHERRQAAIASRFRKQRRKHRHQQ